MSYEQTLYIRSSARSCKCCMDTFARREPKLLLIIAVKTIVVGIAGPTFHSISIRRKVAEIGARTTLLEGGGMHRCFSAGSCFCFIMA